MKILITLLSLAFFAPFSKADVIYLDPIPDAKYVNTENGIIIGLDVIIGQNALNNLEIRVSGTQSGNHSGNLTLSSDKKRILFKPDQPFALSETVTVSIVSNSSILNYNKSTNFSYSFQTQKAKLPYTTEDVLRKELGDNFRAPFNLDNPSPPELEVTISNNPTPGKLFIANFGNTISNLIIANNDGSIFFSRELTYEGMDFKKQPDGTLTYFETKRNKFFQLNDQYEIIDSFETGNGYNTDVHELRLLDNRHALLMAYDRQFVDMSQIVPGGDTNASVVGLIIQELDEDKNVVFQWRSWDHFQITDATKEDLTLEHIDYVHGNAIDVDTDDNLLISSRSMDEITKINRVNGDIIWRLGGKNNQFVFTNDTLMFSHQHAIRRIANGNVTLFDNGNFHNPWFSRAIEYQLDEINKTATLVWEYRNTPTIYGFAMGYVQRLENGNTLIGWGYTSPTLSEVTPAGEIALEMKLPLGQVSYRAFKFDWDGSVSVSNNTGSLPDKYELTQNYPNPFNPSTSISFSVPKPGDVSLKIYDIMGREVATLLNGYKQAGTYNMNFDASNLSSGVYIYQMEAGNYTSSKKMMLIK